MEEGREGGREGGGEGMKHADKLFLDYMTFIWHCSPLPNKAALGGDTALTAGIGGDTVRQLFILTGTQ